MLKFTSKNKATNEDLDGLKIKLPLEYRDFLLNQNGGELEEPLPLFMRPVLDGQSKIELSISYFYNIDEINDIVDNLQDDEDFVDLSPIAETLGSPFICIGNGIENEGRVYIVDSGDFGVTLQAESFTSFVKQLYI